MALADLDVSDFHSARAHRAPPIAATVSTARAPTDMTIGARTTSTQTTAAGRAAARTAVLTGNNPRAVGEFVGDFRGRSGTFGAVSFPSRGRREGAESSKSPDFTGLSSPLWRIPKSGSPLSWNRRLLSPYFLL